MLLLKYEKYYVGYRNTADPELGDYRVISLERVLHIDHKAWLPLQSAAYH